MTENKRFTIKRKDLKYAKILENGKDLTGYFFIAQAKFICDKWNELAEENEQLKKQLNRLYNYFEDWYSEMTSANDFSEIWDNVKEYERWGDVE